jgi:hypothetical protein
MLLNKIQNYSLLRVFLVGLFVLALWPGMASADSHAVDKADKNTIRLVPEAFPELPDPIVRDLQKRRCSIPQPWKSSRPSNVVSGEFKNSGQTDWAILCSVKRKSTVLVYWGALVDQVEEIPGTKISDRKWIKGVAENKVGFSRLITLTNDGFLYDHHEHFPQAAISYVNSNGIVGDYSAQKSTVHYWHENQWVGMPVAEF